MTVSCWNEGFPSGVDSAQPPHPSGLSLPKPVAGLAPDSLLKRFLFTLKSHVFAKSVAVCDPCQLGWEGSQVGTRVRYHWDFLSQFSFLLLMVHGGGFVVACLGYRLLSLYKYLAIYTSECGFYNLSTFFQNSYGEY